VVKEGSPTLQIKVTGVGYFQRSVVYFNDILFRHDSSVPTELQAEVDESLLRTPGRKRSSSERRSRRPAETRRRLVEPRLADCGVQMMLKEGCDQDIHYRTSVSDTFDRRLALCTTRRASSAAADNAQSLEHINAAKKLAADDSFLANPTTFSALQGMRAHKTTMLRIWSR
jgi:hypothetical protein